MFESDSDSDEDVPTTAPVTTQPATVPAVPEAPAKRKYTKRPMTDEQKKALVERLAKAREAKKQKATTKPVPPTPAPAPTPTPAAPAPKPKHKKEKVVQEIHNHFYNHPPASENPSSQPAKPPSRYSNATW